MFNGLLKTPTLFRRESPQLIAIRRATPIDCEILLDRWLRSVRATHTFVLDDDIESMIPQVRVYLSSSDSEIWVASDASGTVMGFMGLSGSKMEALFLAPEFHRRGVGRLLVRYAQALRGELTVDVNEQNPAAIRFYQSCGFTPEGRSELDEEGRPYPLLHMRLVEPMNAPQPACDDVASRANVGRHNGSP